jgi:glycosyltransferase involved in cell wall biosynthesis
MKILQLIYESFGNPYGFGGAGVRACEIYKRLKERHDIILLCMRYPGAQDGEIEGLRHIFVGTESKSLTKSVISYTFKAANFVRKNGNNFDIIIENFLPSTPFFSTFFTKTPVVLQVQGIMERHSFIKFNPFYSIPLYIVEQIYPNLYDKFIFVSEVTKNKVISKVKRKIKICHVIPNGIDSALLHITPEDDDYILFFSRIDIYTKGIDLLLKAFEHISQEYPSLKLVLAGYEFDKVEKLLSGLPSLLKDKISYAGFVTGDEKICLLSKAKIVVLPSRHESSPISILEAAACGKPLIVSDIPELRFVEEEKFGISFSSGSVEGLREKIKLLLNNNELRYHLGQNGREFANKLLWDTIALEYEKVLCSF